MLSRPEPACLLITDISGYTGYLASAELDHAQDVLADLIGTVVGALRPAFRLAKLEGDAAFMWTAADRIDGSQLQDSVESCYAAFQMRLRDIRQASTCECNACILIPNLDLKVIVHHGTVVRQRIMGREELAGADVIVAHRLLKNTVEADLGISAYALYTADCVAAMGVTDPAAIGLRRIEQAYDHVGTVECWVRDLHVVWAERQAATRVIVAPSEAAWTIEAQLPAPPAIAWEWVTSPARRPAWQDGVTGVEEFSAGRRRGVGTTNHCMHGKNASVEEVLDWRPFEYVTIRFQMPIPGAPKLLMTDSFEANEQGTLYTARFGMPRSKKDRLFITEVLPMVKPVMHRSLEALVPLIAADVAARGTAPDAPEPDLPASTGRYATEPVLASAAPDA